MLGTKIKMKKIINTIIIVSISFVLGYAGREAFHKDKELISKKFTFMTEPDEMLKELINDPQCPIKYDADTDEYNIEYGDLENGEKKLSVCIFVH